LIKGIQAEIFQKQTGFQLTRQCAGLKQRAGNIGLTGHVFRAGTIQQASNYGCFKQTFLIRS
jgi:hypothetical protein